jgi:hypothetical protein
MFFVSFSFIMSGFTFKSLNEMILSFILHMWDNGLVLFFCVVILPYTRKRSVADIFTLLILLRFTLREIIIELLQFKNHLFLFYGWGDSEVQSPWTPNTRQLCIQPIAWGL